MIPPILTDWNYVLTRTTVILSGFVNNKPIIIKVPEDIVEFNSNECTLLLTNKLELVVGEPSFDYKVFFPNGKETLITFLSSLKIK